MLLNLPLMLLNLPFLQRLPMIPSSQSMKYNAANQTNQWIPYCGGSEPMGGPKSGLLAGQRVGRWWAKVWAASGPLIISLWIFLFLYFTISTDRNVCRNLNMVLFLVALHNQNITWQQILIYSLILLRWDYLISGSLASDCQNNNKNQIQIIIIYPEEIFNPFLDFFFDDEIWIRFSLSCCWNNHNRFLISSSVIPHCHKDNHNQFIVKVSI